MKKLVALFICGAFILSACGQTVAPTPTPLPQYWPTNGWKASSPEAQGMDSDRLAQMLAHVAEEDVNLRSLLIVRNGYLVTEAYFHPYRPDTKVHVQSLTKSVIGMLIGIAIEQGKLSLNQRVLDFYENEPFPPSRLTNQKRAIELKHLLSMSSGLDCQDFSPTGPTMEASRNWVRFFLSLPMADLPGKSFRYCSGNPHVLSEILQRVTGMSTREYANVMLFQPLGIPAVSEADWGTDPQGVTLGGYGLYLRPVDLAKLALVTLNDGEWDGQQVIPPLWIAESTAQQATKEDGSGYGYLWTVYPAQNHYAGLGLGGQQIHVYPDKNLIVVTTAGLEAYAEAPEIETLLADYILPAIQSDAPLPVNPEAQGHLSQEVEKAANPIQPVSALPPLALDVSGSSYTFDENPMGWKTLALNFEEGASVVKVQVNDWPVLDAGLDNIYRRSVLSPATEMLLRAYWETPDTLVLDYPYPLFGSTVLGQASDSTFRFHFIGDMLEVTAQQLIFGGEPVVVKGSR